MQQTVDRKLGAPRKAQLLQVEEAEEHEADELEAFYTSRVENSSPEKRFYLSCDMFTSVKTEICSTILLQSWSSIKTIMRWGFGSLDMAKKLLQLISQSSLYLKFLVRRDSGSLWIFPWFVDSKWEFSTRVVTKQEGRRVDQPRSESFDSSFAIDSKSTLDNNHFKKHQG